MLKIYNTVVNLVHRVYLPGVCNKDLKIYCVFMYNGSKQKSVTRSTNKN